MLARVGLVLLLAFTTLAASSCSPVSVTAPSRPLVVQASALVDSGIRPGPSRSRADLGATLQLIGASRLSVDATFTNSGPATLTTSNYPLDLVLASPQGERRSARFNFAPVKVFSIPAGVVSPLGKGASVSKHFDVDVSQLEGFSRVETVTVSSATGLDLLVAWLDVPRTR